MSKKTLFIFLFAMTAALANCARAAADWVSYTSNEGRYSVMLPQEPTLTTQQSATSSGTKFPQYLSVASDSNNQYFIAYFDATPNTIEFSFEKGRDGMLRGVHGTLISESPISLGKYEGRELKISAKDESGDEAVITARLYVVERRVYALQHVSKASDASTTAASRTKFFDSFKVIL